MNLETIRDQIEASNLPREDKIGLMFYWAEKLLPYNEGISLSVPRDDIGERLASCVTSKIEQDVAAILNSTFAINNTP